MRLHKGAECWWHPTRPSVPAAGSVLVTLRQIGAYIGRLHLEDAIRVILDGDGHNNAAQTYSVGTGLISGTAGTLSYGALLDFWSQFDPYTMNTMLVSGDVMLNLLKLTEFQNPLTGLNFQGTGTLTTPLGATLLRTSAMPAGKLIGLDKNYALEMINGSDVTVEYDKLIDRQLERAAITASQVCKLFNDASRLRLSEGILNGAVPRDGKGEHARDNFIADPEPHRRG